MTKRTKKAAALQGGRLAARTKAARMRRVAARKAGRLSPALTRVQVPPAVACGALVPKGDGRCGVVGAMFYPGAGAVCAEHVAELETRGHLIMASGRVVQKRSAPDERDVVEREHIAFGAPFDFLSRLAVGRHRTVIVFEAPDPPEQIGPLAGNVGRAIAALTGLKYPLELARFFHGVWIWPSQSGFPVRDGVDLDARIAELKAVLRETRRGRYEVIAMSVRLHLALSPEEPRVDLRLWAPTSGFSPKGSGGAEADRDWWLDRMRFAMAAERRALNPPACLACGAQESAHEGIDASQSHPFKEA